MTLILCRRLAAPGFCYRSLICKLVVISTALIVLDCCSVTAQEPTSDPAGIQSATAIPAPDAVQAEDLIRDAADVLPVTRIIFFNSGVAQILHAGEIQDRQQLRLQFSRHDVDDVLKSLVFEDVDRGTVDAVEYQPAPDQEEIAADRVGAPLTVAQTLQKHRGERVAVVTDTGQIFGTVAGVETRSGGDGSMEFLTVLNESGFVTIPLNNVRSFQFDNSELREEYSLAMTGLRKRRVQSLKHLIVSFEGAGNRRVKFSYVLDAPIWRMTYRLELADETARLLGWAHVDNVTGTDWNGVRIGLRSGQPKTFHVDLFSPVLAERSSLDFDVFGISSEATLISQWLGFDKSVRIADQIRKTPGVGGGFGSVGGGFGGAGTGVNGLDRSRHDDFQTDDQQAQEDLFQHISSTFSSKAIQQHSPQFVSFEIDEPVELKAGRSAMLPVLDLKLAVKNYSLVLDTEPERPAEFVAEIDNNSSFQFVPGPVAVYQGGRFLGDAAMPRVDLSQPHLVTYGDDSLVTLAPPRSSMKSTMREVTMTDRGVRLQWDIIRTRQFTLHNSANDLRNVVLGIRKTNHKVSPSPDSAIPGLMKFHLAVQPASSLEKTISFTESTRDRVAISSITDEQLTRWQEQKAQIDPVVLTRFARFKEIQQELDLAMVALRNAESELARITSEQTRVTNLIKILGADSASGKPYVEQLTALETEFRNARSANEQARSSVTEIKQRLADNEKM